MTINRTIFSGNLVNTTKAPMTILDKVVYFKVCGEDYNSSKKEPEPNFIEFTALDKNTREFLQNKGDQIKSVVVESKLISSPFEQDGKTIYKTSNIVTSLEVTSWREKE